MFGNKPDRLVRCHPVPAIEAREIHRPRESAQRAFESQIEIDVEVTHRQFAQRAINRLAITAAAEVRFRDCAPMSTHFKDREDMVGVLFRFQIEN